MNKENQNKKPIREKSVERRKPSDTLAIEEQGNKVVVIVAVVVTLILALAAGSVFIYAKYQEKKAVEAALEAAGDNDVDVDSSYELYNDYTNILYDGQAYKYNTDIKTILFLGIDQLDGTEEIAGEAGRSDTMILLLVNTATEEVTMLSISRDTQAEVDIANDYGESILSGEMHLAIQYSFGDGGTSSCVLSSNAVSRLLYNIPINYYMSMNLDGLNGVVDAIGGLTMTLEEDYTYIDESLIEGETVVMDGALAETFVRYRDTTELGSNDVRMNRQEYFLEAFVLQMQSKVSSNSASLEFMWNIMNNYLLTNLDIDTIELLASYDMAEESYKVPGETVEGEYHDEYIVDEEELQKIIIKLLYKVN